jgi:hypothetical protein
VRRIATFAIALIFCMALTQLAVASVAGNTKAALNGSNTDKISITTKSDEAKKEFLTGRDLSERLLQQESLAHFDKAIALDPDFALAILLRGNNSSIANEFFEYQKKAEALSGKVSEGERLLILASGAAANGDVAKQKEYLVKLVAIYPRTSERSLIWRPTTSSSKTWTRQ